MVIVSALVCISAQSQSPYYMTNPVGYAGGITGGGTPTSSNTVTVTTAAQLSSALAGSKSVILVFGAIPASRIAGVYTNKTIIGLPGAKLVNPDKTRDGSGILHLREGSTNIIIRNLIFEGPGARESGGQDLLTYKACTRLCLDHCEFRSSTWADDITFTYLKPPKQDNAAGSSDHQYSVLISGSDSLYPGNGHYRTTW